MVLSFLVVNILIFLDNDADDEKHDCLCLLNDQEENVKHNNGQEEVEDDEKSGWTGDEKDPNCFFVISCNFL